MVINEEELKKLIKAAYASLQLWYGFFQKRKDDVNHRNSTLALGKLLGLMSIYAYKEEDVPFPEIWKEAGDIGHHLNSAKEDW